MMNLPSSRELGISSAHRRNLLRESYIQTQRSILRGLLSEAEWWERTNGSDAYVTCTNPEAMGDYYPRAIARCTDKAATYLRRRAAGESPRSIITSLYS